jgi:hypothetical protein
VDSLLPSDASPSWKGVEHGLNLLKKGTIWRVGYGSKNQIWRDPWVPRPPSMSINVRRGHSRIRWVSKLMHGNRREWDEEKLRSCFLPHDVTEIRKIRLSDRAEDMIAWFYERTGLFTVRSA